MGFKYQITDREGIYFVTITVVDWIDVFTRRELAEIVIDSLSYCQQNKGLILYAWCLMPSHLHLIISEQQNQNLSDIIRDFKKHTSKQIVSEIAKINESREWMLNRFKFLGSINPKIILAKFWRDGYHPILLESNRFLEQKLNYIHENPVESGLVTEPQYYNYSSAVNYAGGIGLLEVVFLE